MPAQPSSDRMTRRVASGKGRGEVRGEERGEGRGEERGEGRGEVRGEGRGEGRGERQRCEYSSPAHPILPYPHIILTGASCP